MSIFRGPRYNLLGWIDFMPITFFLIIMNRNVTSSNWENMEWVVAQRVWNVSRIRATCFIMQLQIEINNTG